MRQTNRSVEGGRVLCFQTLSPKSQGFVRSSAGGWPGWELPCQLCVYFGEMKAGFPRIIKGNESSWLRSFLRPFTQWSATPFGPRLDPSCCCETISPGSVHVFCKSGLCLRTTQRKYKSKCLIPFLSPSNTQSQ